MANTLIINPSLNINTKAVNPNNETLCNLCTIQFRVDWESEAGGESAGDGEIKNAFL